MEWHYSKNGQQHGPVSEDELRSLITGCSVSASDHVWNKSMTDWKPVSDIPELSDKPRQVATPQQAPSPQAPQKLSQEQKAEIHRLKEQMKKEYETFVEETHIRAQVKTLENTEFGMLKKRPVLDGNGLRQKRTDKRDLGYDHSEAEGHVGLEYLKKMKHRGYEYLENPDYVFYFEEGCIKDAKHLLTYSINFNVKVHYKGKVDWYKEQAESFAKAEGKGKYDPDFPSLDEFMEWRWRDMDNRGALADGLIDAVQRSH